MTVFTRPDGAKVIKWDPGDPIDWTTPNVGDGIDDEYCGNCGLDAPGCGCPRDCAACQETGTYCGHLAGVAADDGVSTVGIGVEITSDDLAAFLAALAAGERIDMDADLTARALASLARYLPAGVRVSVRASYQRTARPAGKS